MLLALKLALVPAFLAALAIAARVWGPAVAGWLAGLPVVAGPIVLLLALERGMSFAAQASVGAIAAIAASEAFNLAYAWSCRRAGWPIALATGLVAWLGVALLLVHLPTGSTVEMPGHSAAQVSAQVSAHVSAQMPANVSAAHGWAVAVACGPLGLAIATACVAVALSQFGLPRVSGAVPAARVGRVDLALRMLAGMLLTLAVTSLSASLGAAWSGVLSVFPLLGIVLAVSAQRAHGADFVALLARGMVIGRGSFAAFFAVLAMLLPHAGVALSFACAALLSIVVQRATRGLLGARKAAAPELAHQLTTEPAAE